MPRAAAETHVGPLDWIDNEADSWADRGLSRRLRPLGAAEAGRVECDGQVLVNFASNDYLALAADVRVIEAGIAAARHFGWGAGASALVAGWKALHEDLAQQIAAFEGTEAAVVFPTGYAANVGTICALVGRDDVIYSDALNHASLIDGARLSLATVQVYPHADADQLEHCLVRDRGRFRRSLIITDGVFGMDGALAPVADLVNLADRFESMLLVDEAHGTGVFGPDGRGAASELGVADRVSVRIGTLSKALGSLGGFAAGSRSLINWLVNHARPLIYSTALPPAAAAAASKALRIVQAEPWRRTHVRSLADRLRSQFLDAGLHAGRSTGPIVPVVVGRPERVVKLAETLQDAGFLVPAIRPPSVPEGTSRLRISLTAAHTQSDVDALAEAMIAHWPQAG